MYRVNRNFYTFVCWDYDTEVVDLGEYYDEINTGDLLIKINNGTLTNEDKAEMIESMRCSLECGTQLYGKIIDDNSQEINTQVNGSMALLTIHLQSTAHA